MSTAVGAVFALGFLVCGALLAYWQFIALSDWLGLLVAILITIFLIPSISVFPFIYWLVEGSLPAQYITVWAVGMVCSILAEVLFRRS